MIVLSLMHFYVFRYMADREYIMASIYMKIYAKHRMYARKTFYVGLVCFMISIGIYLAQRLNVYTMVTVIALQCIGVGIIVYTLRSMTTPSTIAGNLFGAAVECLHHGDGHCFAVHW